MRLRRSLARRRFFGVFALAMKLSFLTRWMKTSLDIHSGGHFAVSHMTIYSFFASKEKKRDMRIQDAVKDIVMGLIEKINYDLLDWDDLAVVTPVAKRQNIYLLVAELPTNRLSPW